MKDGDRRLCFFISRGVMSKVTFWTAIDSARKKSRGDYDKQVAEIKRHLEGLSIEDITPFANALDSALSAAYTFPLMVAAFVINGYISDDVFEDFREWLVLLGEKNYRAILDDPDVIAEVITRKETQNVGGHGLGELPLKICLEKGWDEEELFTRVKAARPPKIKQDWPESRADFERQYPILYRAFWDQEKIRARHA